MRLHFTHIWPLLSLPRFPKQGNGQEEGSCNSSASPPCAHSAAQGAPEVMSGLLPRGQGLVCVARRLNRPQSNPYSNSHGLLADAHNERDYTDTSTSSSTSSRHSHFLDVSTVALMWERCSDWPGCWGSVRKPVDTIGNTWRWMQIVIGAHKTLKKRERERKISGELKSSNLPYLWNILLSAHFSFMITYIMLHWK